jgi:hypothetical protein
LLQLLAQLLKLLYYVVKQTQEETNMDLRTTLSQLKTAGISEDALLISIKWAINYDLIDQMQKTLGVDHYTAIKLAVASKLCEFANYPIEPYWVAPDLPALDFGAWVADNYLMLDHEQHGPTILSSLRLLYLQAPMLINPKQKPKRLLPKGA